VRTLGPFTDKDLLYIKTATLPGKTVNNQTVPFMGLDFNIPGSVKYTGSEAWALNFRCDEGLNIRNKMENWIKEIFDIQTSSGKYGVPVEVATMDLLGKDLAPIRRYNFIGIYPVSMDPINYNIEGTGAPLDFNATFAYQWWQLVG
jgi:hypothetical protein